MPLYLIDSDTLPHFRNGHSAVVRNVLSHPLADLAASVITLEEHLNGWYTELRKAKSVDRLENAYRKLAGVVEFFVGFPILPFARPAILRSQAFLRMNLNVKKQDLRIASIAIEYEAIVATCNLSDFQRIPGVVVEDWSR